MKEIAVLLVTWSLLRRSALALLSAPSSTKLTHRHHDQTWPPGASSQAEGRKHRAKHLTRMPFMSAYHCTGKPLASCSQGLSFNDEIHHAKDAQCPCLNSCCSPPGCTHHTLPEHLIRTVSTHSHSLCPPPERCRLHPGHQPPDQPPVFKRAVPGHRPGPIAAAMKIRRVLNTSGRCFCCLGRGSCLPLPL
jgi:hypothetical protein